MSIQKDIEELLEKGVINEDVAHRLSVYYHQSEQQQNNRIMLIFSSIGATLIGLGIILMIAHNWDDFSRGFKTVLSILPILLGQIFCAYSFFKKPSWLEAATVFLGLGIGASITLIAQVYHIAGNDNPFFFTWTALTIPILLLQRTQITSLLCLILTTAFGLSYSHAYEDFPLWSYWIFYGAILFYFIYINTQSPSSFYKRSFIWLLAFSPILILFKYADRNDELLYILYFLLFTIYFTLSRYHFRNQKISSSNALQFISIIGMNIVMMIMTFQNTWHHLIDEKIQWGSELMMMLTLLIVAVFLYLRSTDKSAYLRLYQYLIIPFAIIFISGFYTELSFFLMNILVLFVSIYTIQQGLRANSLSITNIGLLSLGGLIISRFFDNDFSFVVRGIVFVVLGIAFLMTNYFMLKNHKKHAA